MDDPLFMRIPSGLQQTERAQPACATTARGAGRDPQRGRKLRCSTRPRPPALRHAAGSYFCMLIVPSLIALARKSAPGITLQIVNTSADVAQALDQQQVDIALGAFEKVPPRLRSEVLFRDEKAWAIGTHHPLAKQPFDHAAFLAWPRLAIGLARAADKSREPPARQRSRISRHSGDGR